jgi:micrococcal nuclease
VSETDSFGRLLRYVYLPEAFVNAELVKQGYAQAVTYPPDIKYTDFFLQLQEQARSAGPGLWGNVCKATPTIPPKPAATKQPTSRPPTPRPPTPVPSPPSGGVCGTSYSPSGPDRDCPDFTSQGQAQCLFIAAGGPSRDPHRLDADNDGIACEANPYRLEKTGP